MKNTIFTVLLFSMAGAAMAATPLTLSWEGNSTSLSSQNFKDEATTITVAYTYDIGKFYALREGMPNLLKIIDKNNNTLGMGLSPRYTNNVGYTYFEGWYNGLIDSRQLFLNGTATAYMTPPQYGVIIYTLTQNESGFTFSLDRIYLSEAGDLIDRDPVENVCSADSYTFNMLTTLSINTEYLKTDEVEVYDEIIPADQRVSLAKALVFQTDSTVPEPTTATLSLMALAALAARRRRK